MTPRRRLTDRPDLSQTDIFELLQEQVPEAGSMDFDRELRAVLADALRDACGRDGSRLSRAQVAARMTELVGEENEVTVSKLNAWTAESKSDHQFPLRFLVPFEVATNTTRVSLWLGRRRGFLPMFGKEAIYAEVARRKARIERENAEVAMLERIAKEGRR